MVVSYTSRRSFWIENRLDFLSGSETRTKNKCDYHRRGMYGFKDMEEHMLPFDQRGKLLEQEIDYESACTFSSSNPE